ncbi:DUF2058 domain-containing protein [Psychromonas sp. 14N.309.X.WAT.B.A12]|uniref:DUF2058 domain-containing protein n=1 Tax=Psychromonas sp. 14N.309.X.WAT.B.A12 TaxID=2998322 RepID=UPI0025B10008|nr:DUF2058 domain-containing protein [Psychromonas sp. 14N.309.X.WAT.B.A12]MDN2663238.1 DUF2058 domain-containing protein [Psychromonas sp. 14N.309.X.WAT.B.A12]
MASLQDQLMNSGLINKQKAKQAQTEKRRQAKQKKKKGTVAVSDLQKAVQEKAELQKQKDLENNQQSQQELAARAAHGKLIQMIAQHCEKDYQGELDYHFTYDNKVKRIAVTPKIQQGLIKGSFAICVLNDEFYLINKEAAEKLRAIDESVLVALHDQSENDTATDEDDPYAEFAIPDDLMW